MVKKMYQYWKNVNSYIVFEPHNRGVFWLWDDGCQYIILHEKKMFRKYLSVYLISLIEILFGLLNLNLEFPNHLNIFCDAECKIKNNYDKEIFFNVLNVFHGSNFSLQKGFD